MKAKSNQHKMKFLKCKRFVDDDSAELRSNNTPQPRALSQSSANPLTTATTTTATMVNMKPHSKSPSSVKARSTSTDQQQQQQPFFYYQSTSVPELVMSFNRDRIMTPAPGRYSPHDVTCKCYLTHDAAADSNDIKCPGRVEGNGHQHVFQSNVMRLVRPLPPNSMRRRRRWSKLENAMTESGGSNFQLKATDDSLMETLRARLPREPISFRAKRSKSSDDLVELAREREFRFNTVIKRKHLVSVKRDDRLDFSPQRQGSSNSTLSRQVQKNVIKSK